VVKGALLARLLTCTSYLHCNSSCKRVRQPAQSAVYSAREHENSFRPQQCPSAKDWNHKNCASCASCPAWATPRQASVWSFCSTPWRDAQVGDGESKKVIPLPRGFDCTWCARRLLPYACCSKARLLLLREDLKLTCMLGWFACECVDAVARRSSPDTQSLAQTLQAT
jgi:hypothetical protein